MIELRAIAKLMTCIFCIVFLAGSVVSAEDYQLGPGDVLNISVWGLDDLSANAQVSSITNVSKTDQTANGVIIRPDGKISLPLVGEITAGGLTAAQLTNSITQALKEYIHDPKVTINISKFRTTRVYVLGEVIRPGMYELDKQHNVLDAIGVAGGYTQYAAKKSVFLVRSGRTAEPLKVNLLQLLKQGDMSQNYALGEGDVVYLTSSGKLDFTRDVLPLITGGYYITHFDNK